MEERIFPQITGCNFKQIYRSTWVIYWNLCSSSQFIFHILFFFASRLLRFLLQHNKAEQTPQIFPPANTTVSNKKMLFGVIHEDIFYSDVSTTNTLSFVFVYVLVICNISRWSMQQVLKLQKKKKKIPQSTLLFHMSPATVCPLKCAFKTLGNKTGCLSGANGKTRVYGEPNTSNVSL